MPPTNPHLFSEFLEVTESLTHQIAISYRSEQSHKNISYEELLSASLFLAQQLKEKFSLAAGDRVCIVAENQPEFAYAFWALMSLDVTVIPLDVQYTPQKIKECVTHASAKLLLTVGKFADKLKAVLPPEQVFVIDGVTPTKAGAQSEGWIPADAGMTKSAVFFYTSGTTDQPKAVMLSHANILSNVHAFKDLNIVSEKDIVLAMLPLHHAYALTVTMIAPLLGGARVVFPASTSSNDILTAVRENHVTIFVGVPQVFSLIHRSIQNKIKVMPDSKRCVVSVAGNVLGALRSACGVNLSKNFFKEMHNNLGADVRFMVSGGAKLDVDAARDFFKWGFTILEGYGLTETSPVAAFNPLTRPKIGSVGKPLPGVEIKIHESYLRHPGGGVGEVLIKGPNVMQGYYQQEAMTKEILKDGWFYSGDLGYIDADGYVFLTGRKKEIIVLSSGKNISPEEVEKIYSGIPLIKELAVLAVKAPGFVRGVEQLAAIVVIDNEYVKSRKEINIYERLKWDLENVSAKLPSYQRITGFVISQDAIPRTRLGKIMRYQLNDLYNKLSQSKKPQAAVSADMNIALDPSDVAQSTLTSLSQIFNRQVYLKDHMELDLGLDSLSRIELLLNLQERLKLKLSDEQSTEFFTCNTVEDLITKLEALMAATNPTVTREGVDVSWKAILNEPANPATLKRIKINFGILGMSFGVLVLTLFKVVFGLLFMLKVQGRANLPLRGPYLICPNHTSFLDGFMIACALPYKVGLQTYFLGGSIFFDTFLVRPFLRVAKLVPIEMGHNLQEALRACAYILRNNKIMCLFPEGQRSIDGKVGFFKKGAGILIKELDLTVVPVYIEGTFEAWPRNQRFPRIHPVKVVIGKPLNSKDLGKSEGAADPYRAIASQLQGQVESLVTNNV